MSKITKIEVQKKDKNRVNLYVDDEFYHGLALDTVVKHGLKVGDDIDEKHFSDIVLESERITLFNKCLDYIGSSYKTAKQVRDYLKRKDYDSALIDETLAKLKEYRVLDDANFAQMYISTYKTKYGNNMLKKKLLEKGVSKTTIDTLLDENDTDEDVVRHLALKKLGSKEPTFENLAKVMRFLVGRGFDYDIVNSVCKNFGQDTESRDIYN